MHRGDTHLEVYLNSKHYLVMRCCPPSSTFGFERIFNRIRCVLACCGGQVIVENSEFCDGEKARKYLPQPQSPGKFRWFRCCVQSGQRGGKSKISRKQVQDWLSQQDVYTLHEPARRHYKRSRVIVPGINAQFQADLVDVQKLSRFNKGYKYLLTCVDISTIKILKTVLSCLCLLLCAVNVNDDIII